MGKIGYQQSNGEDLADINKELDSYRKRVAAIRARSGDFSPISDDDLAKAGEVVLSRDHIRKLLTKKAAAQSGSLMESWLAGVDADRTKLLDEAKKGSDTIDAYL